MAFTLAEKTEFYTAWKAAYLAVSTGKSYTFSKGGATRSLTRADKKECRDEMMFWKSEIDKENAGRYGLNMKFGRVSNRF